MNTPGTLNNKLVIGLTGGIGSGKTAASDHFAELGVSVVDADVIARQVVEPGSPALQQIAGHFGDAVLQPDGSLDRRALRGIVFSDDNQRQWLESLLHPLIRQGIFDALQRSPSAYALLVSPLLLETDQHSLCDRVLLIDAPESLQISRTQTRDNTDEQGVRAIMAKQLPRSKRQALADDIIINDKDLTALHEAVSALHHTYLEMAHARSATQS